MSYEHFLIPIFYVIIGTYYRLKYSKKSANTVNIYICKFVSIRSNIKANESGSTELSLQISCVCF